MWKKLLLRAKSLDIYRNYNGSGEISLGVGNKNSKIMVIMNNIEDEALMDNIYETFEAKKLRSVFNAVGIDLEKDVYLTSFYKLDRKKLIINPKSQEELVDLLISEIVLINPEIIITLGEEVFKILISDSFNIELDKLRIDFTNNVSKMFEYNKKVLIPLYSMDEISKQPKEKKIEVVEILKKIKEI